jgi:hypothetical protein
MTRRGAGLSAGSKSGDPTAVVGQGRTISMSAMKTGIFRNSARKYSRQNEFMEQRKVPHT